jgi:hypothetical protein
VRLLALAFVTGCGATSHGNGDAAADVAGPDARTCHAGQPWSTPMPVTSLNNASANDAQARFTPDELTVYLQSDRDSTDVNIWTAHRASLTAPFDAPVQAAFASGPTNDFDPTIAPDGLTFAMGRDSSDILVATRSSPTGAFSTPVPADTINSATDAEAQPYLTASSIWFISTRDGTSDLFRAPFSAGAFGDPAAIAELNTADVEWLPTPASDELEIFFASDRADPASKGGYEIWTATRTTATAVFSAPVLVPELDSAADDVPSWISADGCRLYISSTRAGASYDIYMATR